MPVLGLTLTYKNNNAQQRQALYVLIIEINFFSLQYQRILEYNGQDTLPDTWWGTLAPTPSAHR